MIGKFRNDWTANRCFDIKTTGDISIGQKAEAGIARDRPGEFSSLPGRAVRANSREIAFLASFAMDLPVAFPTQGDEILFSVMAQPTSGHDVVHFESRT